VFSAWVSYCSQCNTQPVDRIGDLVSLFWQAAMEHLSVELETNKDTYKLKFEARTFDCWCLKFLIGMLANHQVLLLKFSQLSMIEGKTFLPSNSSSFTSSLLQLYKRNSFYLGSAFRSEGRSFRMCIQPGQIRRCATSGYQSSSTSMIMD
jgi:hypothetical protein